MKIVLLLILLLFLSCSKKETPPESSVSQVIDQSGAQVSVDSAGSGLAVLPEEPAKNISNTFRVVDGDKIIKTINGDMIPLKIADEFTTDHQQFILQIKNFTGKRITAKISPENPEMNIRFNQIKLADGNFDGPFGRDLIYDLKKTGEIWLLISKSNMASGQTTGNFTVEIE